MHLTMHLFGFILIITNVFSLCVGEDELVAVTALIRHGKRIPESFYPNDPYTNYSWPYVLGDLTNDGIREMYDTGKWLRKKYNTFLSEKYNPDQIYAHAINYDRCIMTGEATLAGLYPPISDEIWNRKLLWQPIPIHVSPLNQDIIGNANSCPKIPAESDLIKKTRIYREIMAKFGEYFAFISRKCGTSTDFASLYPLFDTLYSEEKLGLTLPLWAQEIWPDFLPLVVQYTKMDSMTTTEKRIQVGPMLTALVSQFDRAITGIDFGTTNTIYRKYMAYFVTEWNLYDLTYTLGLPGIGIPDFGALYLIELKKKPEGEYYVNILYRNSAKKGTRAVRVAMEGENVNLGYEKFKKLVEPFMVDSKEWKELCEDFTKTKVKLATKVPMS